MKSNIFKYVTCAVMALGLAATVQATSITGGISLSGGPITVNTGDLATGTAITGFGIVGVDSVSGSYLGVPTGVSSPIVWTAGFQFLPVLSPSVIRTWAFLYGGNVYYFDLSTIQGVSQGVDINGTHYLTLTGTGTLHIDGFTDTAGSYLLTANSASSTFSFSSSNGAMVPDGGMTVLLLGAALSGLALIRRKLA